MENEGGLLSYPASDPPTHGKVAGVNAGAFPALEAVVEALEEKSGDGLFKIATNGARDRKGSYGSCTLRGIRPPLVRGGLDKSRISSRCSLGINPGSIGVPPTTRILDIMVLLRSIGT